MVLEVHQLADLDNKTMALIPLNQDPHLTCSVPSFIVEISADFHHAPNSTLRYLDVTYQRRSHRKECMWIFELHSTMIIV